MSKTKLVLLTAAVAILSTWLAIGAAVGVYMVVTAPEKEPEPYRVLPYLTEENVEKITLDYYYYMPKDGLDDYVDIPAADILVEELIVLFNSMTVSGVRTDGGLEMYGADQFTFKIHMTDGTVYEIHPADQLEDTAPSGYAIQENSTLFTPIVTYHDYLEVKINGVYYNVANPEITYNRLHGYSREIRHFYALEQERANENN